MLKTIMIKTIIYCAEIKSNSLLCTGRKKFEFEKFRNYEIISENSKHMLDLPQIFQ